MTANALTSLFGRGGAEDLNVTRAREIMCMPGKREQTVLTPACVLDPLRSVWGTIAFDPCSPPRNALIWVPCDLCVSRSRKDKPLDPACRWCRGARGAEYCSLVGATYSCSLPANGLALRWIDCSFCNPEFAELEPWFSPKTEPGARVEWLVPVRPHRRWWRAWARTCDVLIYLNPIAFVGHAQTFPAPLCLGYRGRDAAQIVNAYRDLGEPI